MRKHLQSTFNSIDLYFERATKRFCVFCVCMMCSRWVIDTATMTTAAAALNEIKTKLDKAGGIFQHSRQYLL